MGEKSKIKVIIDCDPGTDDAHAILIALAHQELIEVLAVCSVVGNSSIDNTTTNALRVLKFANRLDIPIYRGCSTTLLGRPSVHDAVHHFHGKDGMGDINIEGVDPVDLSLVQKDSAPLALVNLVSRYPETSRAEHKESIGLDGCLKAFTKELCPSYLPIFTTGEITLLAVGPLTNVAAALLVDEEFGKKLKNCVIMGGNIKGAGNVTRSAEFNFYSDPEAAEKVLQGLGRQITLVPYDTCIQHGIPWDHYYKLVGQSNRTSKLLKKIDEYMLDRVKGEGTWHEDWKDGFVGWDQMAMAVVLRPDVVTEDRVITAAVELGGHLTRGQMVVGCPRARDLHQGARDNVRVVIKLDMKIFLQIIEKTNSFEFN